MLVLYDFKSNILTFLLISAAMLHIVNVKILKKNQITQNRCVLGIGHLEHMNLKFSNKFKYFQ